MIKFLFKGLMRDRSRSLFPILTVISGVFLTVVLFSWIKGAERNIVESSARFSTGHLKIMSRAYARESEQVPNDLALVGVGDLLRKLEEEYPSLQWLPRIRFGGLLDIPDEAGETRSQGPVIGLAVDLHSPGSPEREIFNLDTSLIRGRIPERPGEILVSEEFASRLEFGPGETATLISSTMNGGMAINNFKVTGTVRFGITALDRGAMLADITDVRLALDMEDAAGEILGLYRSDFYVMHTADELADSFNRRFEGQDDEFLPTMVTLHSQNGLEGMLDLFGIFSSVIAFLFIFAMAIVLWNAGLMGSLRRYGEIGVRLAMGESKGHLYRSLIAESMMVGVIGSALGTALGLGVAYLLQTKGVNISAFMKNATIMMTEVMRARITPFSYVIGFIPGLLATFLGTAISGIGIFKRKTSQLMKELES